MAWFELHQGMHRHPKTMRFARAFGVDRVSAVGILVGLWDWALDYAQDGDVEGRFDEIVDFLRSPSLDPEKLSKSLEETGWIDRDDEGRHIIHDWKEYGLKNLERRRKAVKRTQKHRKVNAQQDRKTEDVTHNKRAAYAQVTSLHDMTPTGHETLSDERDPRVARASASGQEQNRPKNTTSHAEAENRPVIARRRVTAPSARSFPAGGGSPEIDKGVHIEQGGLDQGPDGRREPSGQNDGLHGDSGEFSPSQSSPEVEKSKKQKFLRFEEWWKLYPNKVDKTRAQKLYQKAAAEVGEDEIFAMLEIWKKTRRWKDGVILGGGRFFFDNRHLRESIPMEDRHLVDGGVPEVVHEPRRHASSSGGAVRGAAATAVEEAQRRLAERARMAAQ